MTPGSYEFGLEDGGVVVLARDGARHRPRDVERLFRRALAGDPGAQAAVAALDWTGRRAPAPAGAGAAAVAGAGAAVAGAGAAVAGGR